MTDAKTLDVQAGFEKATSVVLAALAGSNFIHHAAGMLENMSIVALEQYVIDNDILGMAMRLVRGVELNDETLALDVIDEVGGGGPSGVGDVAAGWWSDRATFWRITSRSRSTRAWKVGSANGLSYGFHRLLLSGS
jgi:hypothetical protein